MLKMTLLAQLLMYLPGNNLARNTSKYHGDAYNSHFSTKAHLTVLLAAQMRGWKSLREIETGFLSKENKLYHLGISKLPKRSTLSDANNKRDYRIFQDTFYDLLSLTTRKLSNTNKLKIKKDLNLFDSTVITLSLELFKWAKFRRDGGFKIHTAFNVQSQSPIFAQITHGNVNDIDGFDYDIEKYSDSIMVFDKGYLSTQLFRQLDDSGIIFVTRMKKGIKYRIVKSNLVNKRGVRKDQHIQFIGDRAKRNYVRNIRLVTFVSDDKQYQFLTNQFSYSPATIAYLYKKRWDIELFFKWIKQNLVIKEYLGYSENAVQTQVWCSLISYLLQLYVKESINFSGGMLEFTRLVRESLFDDVGLLDLNSSKIISKNKEMLENNLQVNLFT